MALNIVYDFAARKIAGGLDAINVEASTVIAKSTVGLDKPTPEIYPENGDVPLAGLAVGVDVGNSEF